MEIKKGRTYRVTYEAVAGFDTNYNGDGTLYLGNAFSHRTNEHVKDITPVPLIEVGRFYEHEKYNAIFVFTEHDEFVIVKRLGNVREHWAVNNNVGYVTAERNLMKELLTEVPNPFGDK